MKKPKKQRKFLHKPFYPGGKKAMNTFVESHITYPEEAIPHQINGKVEIELTINHKGKVTNVKVLKGLGHGCDEEAVRLGMLLRFSVEKNRNMKVIFRRKIQIHFRPPVKKPTASSIQYTYTSPSKSKSASKPSKSTSYTYKIDIK